MEPLDCPARRVSLALTAICAAAVLVLAVKVRGIGASWLWIDVEGQRVAFGHLFGAPVLPVTAADWVVRLGSTPVFAASAAAVIVVALGLRDRFTAAVALLACPLALLATETIGKPLVGRREGGSYGFPSGHTTVIATVITLVALVAYRRWRWRGLTVVAPVAAVVPLMGLALVRVNLHRFSDTVGGGLVGFGTVLGLAWLVSMASLARRSPASRVRSAPDGPPYGGHTPAR